VKQALRGGACRIVDVKILHRINHEIDLTPKPGRNRQTYVRESRVVSNPTHRNRLPIGVRCHSSVW
jgi:hypothetical protein